MMCGWTWEVKEEEKTEFWCRRERDSPDGNENVKSVQDLIWDLKRAVTMHRFIKFRFEIIFPSKENCIFTSFSSIIFHQKNSISQILNFCSPEAKLKNENRRKTFLEYENNFEIRQRKYFQYQTSRVHKKNFLKLFLLK